MSDQAPELQVQGELTDAGLDALAEFLVMTWELLGGEGADVRDRRDSVCEVEGETAIRGQSGTGGG